VIGAITAGLYGTGVPPVTNSYESIATVNVASTTSFIEFTSIPSTFKHLQIRMISGDPTDGNYQNDLNLRFNSDTTSNYNQHGLYGDGSSVTAFGQAATYILIGQVGGVTNRSVSVVDILDYTSTNKLKTIRMFNGVDRNGSGTVGLRSGLWRKTPEAITTIRIYSSDIAANSQFALYGIKG
jgi:hypothetical protein